MLILIKIFLADCENIYKTTFINKAMKVLEITDKDDMLIYAFLNSYMIPPEGADNIGNTTIFVRCCLKLPFSKEKRKHWRKDNDDKGGKWRKLWGNYGNTDRNIRENRISWNYISPVLPGDIKCFSERFRITSKYDRVVNGWAAVLLMRNASSHTHKNQIQAYAHHGHSNCFIVYK